MPLAERPLVVFRPMPDATVLRVHPLAELAVRERVAPLDMPLDMFRQRALDGARQFALTAVHSDTGAAIAAQPISDDFALGQFVLMSDDKKLSLPAFTSAPCRDPLHDRAVAFGAEPLSMRRLPTRRR